MSPIYDRLAALPLAEQQRWRREYDLLADNACGCHSAAATLATASIFSAATIARADHRPKTAALAICLTLSATVLSKIAAQHKASEREKQLSVILDQRIAEVMGCQQVARPRSHIQAAPADSFEYLGDGDPASRAPNTQRRAPA